MGTFIGLAWGSYIKLEHIKLFPGRSRDSFTRIAIISLVPPNATEGVPPQVSDPPRVGL